MAILVFCLAGLLLAAGLAAAFMSLDLLPTGPGLLYAFAGAAAASMAVVAFAVGVAIRRIDGLVEMMKQANPGEGAPRDAAPPSSLELEPAEGEAERAEVEAPINENRAGRLPSFGEGQGAAIQAPEAPPSLVGRYSAGGANYMIFSDGSIEAETPEGTFKFASMIEFKHYLAERKNAKT